MNINPGEMNRRIVILRRTETPDGDGYPAETLEEAHSCWAKFTRTSGRELVRANADFTEVKARFLIRHTEKEINRKMLVRYAGDDYEIIYVNDYGDAHQYIEIWCRRLTQEG